MAFTILQTFDVANVTLEARIITIRNHQLGKIIL